MDQGYLDQVGTHRREVLALQPFNVQELVTKWEFYLEEAATRLDRGPHEEFSHRRGTYTLVPAADSENEMEDVSGVVRSDHETFVAYSQGLSCGVREILRMLREDGMPAREAWHYVLLLRDFQSESPIHPYFDAFGFVPTDMWMVVKSQNVESGFGGWTMSPKCMRGCVKYFLTQTQYSPFPSAALLEEAEIQTEDITPETLRDYFGSNLILSENEWSRLAALHTSTGYSPSRVLQLAMNYGLACVKLKTSDLQSPFEQSEDAKRVDIFERLRLEELMLGGRFGVHSERDQRALAADERSDEHALVEYMLSQMLETRERAITFRAFDRGVSLRRIFQVRANFEDRLYEELQGVRFESSSAAVELFLKLLEETFNAEQVEASVEEGAEGVGENV